METEAIYLLLAFFCAGTLSLWSYLSFRRGADRPSQRAVASFAIRSGMRHLPVMQVAGAAFWYSIVLAALTAYLPEGPIQTFGMGAGLLLVLTTVVLMVVWAYRPPRWLIPDWFRSDFDAAGKLSGTRWSRFLNQVMLWLATAFICGAYAAHRLDAPWYVQGAIAVVGGVFFVGYVVRD
jgi:hypothetical protein